MTEKKVYQINTVQDMIDCTNENNLDYFLKDLKNMIKYAHGLQNLLDTIAEVNNIPKNVSQIKSNGFKWIDDGKHDINIELKSNK